MTLACEDAEFMLPLVVNVELKYWISHSCYMHLLKCLHGFVKVVTCISCPLPATAKLKFDQDFEARLLLGSVVLLAMFAFKSRPRHGINFSISRKLQKFCCSNIWPPQTWHLTVFPPHLSKQRVRLSFRWEC